MIKLTNFQKRILKQNLAEIAAKNTEAYFGDLVFAFEWIDNHEEFNEKTIIFISRKNGIELNYLDNPRIQSYLGWAGMVINRLTPLICSILQPFMMVGIREMKHLQQTKSVIILIFEMKTMTDFVVFANIKSQKQSGLQSQLKN